MFRTGTLVLFNDTFEDDGYFAVGVILDTLKNNKYSDCIVHFADENELIYISEHTIKEYADDWVKFLKKRKQK